MKTDISSHFFICIREREELQEPSWERLQTISQDWHPVHRSGIMEIALILTASQGVHYSEQAIYSSI
jgi:hypothetical protein